MADTPQQIDLPFAQRRFPEFLGHFIVSKIMEMGIILNSSETITISISPRSWLRKGRDPNLGGSKREFLYWQEDKKKETKMGKGFLSSLSFLATYLDLDKLYELT